MLSAHAVPRNLRGGCFRIAGLAKASPDQLRDPLLWGWSCHRSNARVPPGFDFDIRRQTSYVDKAPDVHDCPLVEGGDSGGKRIDNLEENARGSRTINISDGFSQIDNGVQDSVTVFRGDRSFVMQIFFPWAV